VQVSSNSLPAALGCGTIVAAADQAKKLPNARSSRPDLSESGQADVLMGDRMPHKFKIDDVVIAKATRKLNMPEGIYEIVKRLPSNRGGYEYWIKSDDKLYERIAR
jgi:hypothetical protein